MTNYKLERQKRATAVLQSKVNLLPHWVTARIAGAREWKGK